MLKRALALTALLAALLAPTAAVADPAFGPGNGEQVGDRCHPPGQTVDLPGCK